jgi:FtsH-binding integral membrane protein
MADFQTQSIGARAGLAIDAGLREHMNKVYGLMSVAMVVTGGVAWAVGTSSLITLFRNPETFHLNLLGWIVAIIPFVMVMAFGSLLPRMSVAAAQLFFYVYAAAMGLSLSFIFLAYTGASIATTFLSTAIAFGGLSLYGSTTKRDLSVIGGFLMMGVFGLLGAMILNIFIGSSALQFAISVIGVLIFAGLTAYDTQSIKGNYVANARAGNEDWMAKSAIMGALQLYLDFINMFTFLLQFMGDRR